MDADIDTQAKALWDACQTVKPDWDQLGDVTKGVWREKVAAGLAPADYLGPFSKPPTDSVDASPAPQAAVEAQ
jgi:hypothetical protein